MNGLVPAGLKY